MLSKPTEPNWSFNDHPAIRLLLCCLSPTADSHTVEQLKTLGQADIDWVALVELAKKHKVGLLFHHRLSTTGIVPMPEAIQTHLRHYSQTMTIRNLQVTSELTRLLSLMAANDIDTLPYKGPILAQTLYKTLSLRVYSDLDIVVQPQDMYAVEALLLGEGYRPYHGKKNRAELAAHMRSPAEHTYDFYHDSKRVLIEVHWRFWPTTFSTVNPRDIWHRRQTATLAGTPVSNLTLEDYLIILCMHGSRHLWQRLSWQCDIAMLLHNYPNLNWQQVITQASQWGVQRMLFLGLYLAHTWLKAPLPETILRQLAADSALPALAAQVDYKTFQQGSSPKTFMATTHYQLQVRERWQDKATYASGFGQWLLKGCP